MTETAATQVHIWYHCHQCSAQPIAGRRWHCHTCPEGPENDLCDACYQAYRAGTVQHPPRSSPGFGLVPGPHHFEASEGQPAERFQPWLQVPLPPASAAPQVPDRFVVRPEFCSGLSSAFGGYAFAVREAGRPLVLTALHVMDEMIQKKGIQATAANTSYTGRELPAVLTGVQLYDLFAANWMLAELGRVGPMLVLPAARTGEEEPYSDLDLAAFDATGSSAPLSYGTLAAAPPQVGQPAWLAVSQPGSSQRTLEAVVVEHTERTLVFRYRDPAANPLYSSGAPWLNAAGEVVGINVGGGRLEGQRVGHANHVTSIRRHLATALA